MDFTRRSILLGLAALGLNAGDAFAQRKRKPARRAKVGRPSRKAAAAAPTPPPPPKRPPGRPLLVPDLVELRDGESFMLEARATTRDLVPDKSVMVAGYNGGHLGPALKVRRGARPVVRLVNGLERPTNLIWHGLLVDGAVTASLDPLPPGGSREMPLAVDQSAATLWYHARVPGRMADDVIDGLAGMLIVDDEAAETLGLPSTWGVDDIPLVLQDCDFDEEGRVLRVRTPEIAARGHRGTKVLANGTLDAVADVPQRLVRLRIVNASIARVYRFYLEDERPFRLIATDGGFLPEPVELDTASLAPGERIEILVDFSDGGTALMSTPDLQEQREGSRIIKLQDVVSAPFRVCAFHTTRDDKPSHRVPETLVPLPEIDPGLAVRRRRFLLETDPPAGRSGPTSSPSPAQTKTDRGPSPAEIPAMTINRKSFDAERIDERVAFGSTEIWDIVAPDMAHPFHIDGVQVRVVAEDGGTPKVWNRGVKDTVFVENSMSLLVTFTRKAGPDAPFLYQCHNLEHADAGMMGTFTAQ